MLLRRWGSRIVPCLFAVACRGAIEPVDPLNTVRVMSFNILHDVGSVNRGIPAWYEGRAGLVIENIGTELPDVLGLQEALIWQAESLVVALPQYDFVGRGRDAAGTGQSVSILYRSDRFDLVESGHFWFSDTPDVPGSRGGAEWGTPSTPMMATWVRLTRRDTGRSFYVYNTHLPSDGLALDGPTARFRGARLLVERIAARTRPDEFFFVTGDFNSTETDPPITYLRGVRCMAGASGCTTPPPPEFLAIDTWRAGNPADTRTGSECSNTTAGDGDRIDYVFAWNPLGREPRVLDARIVLHGNTCASDHRAVVVSAQMPASDG